ncbi:MAG: hypothetical protein SGJ01_02350 [Gemmatimonadota bacterium]|nr:hypothetical protein [Gemmatimonadota bacterium]
MTPLPRLLSALLLVLFAASTSVDAALEQSAASGPASSAPAHDERTAPCAGLCACHVSCVQAVVAEPPSPLTLPTPQPSLLPDLAPSSRAPELSTPPPKR